MDIVGLIPDDVIIVTILSRLDLTTLARAAAVSKPWRALSCLASPLAARVPWLLGGISSDSTSTSSLLDLNLNPPTIHLPRRPSASVMPNPFRYVGVADGNLIITPKSLCHTALALYNPFSGDTRQLVPNGNSMPVDQLRFQMVRVLSELGLVVAIRGLRNSLYTYRLGHSGAHWVFSNLNYVSDFIVYGGVLYCIDYGEVIYAFCLKDMLADASHTHPKTVYPVRERNIDFYFTYCVYHLLESDGDLLLFILKCVRSVDGEHEFECLLSKILFDQQGKLVSLVRVKDLGDRLLLVSEVGGSVSCSVPPDPSGLFKKNCVYFVHPRSGCARFTVAELILSGGEMENFVVYPPQIPEFKDWPVWITPSLTLSSIRS